eukprot:s425_g20.t1
MRVAKEPTRGTEEQGPPVVCHSVPFGSFQSLPVTSFQPPAVSEGSKETTREEGRAPSAGGAGVDRRWTEEEVNGGRKTRRAKRERASRAVRYTSLSPVSSRRRQAVRRGPVHFTFPFTLRTGPPVPHGPSRLRRVRTERRETA